MSMKELYEMTDEELRSVVRETRLAYVEHKLAVDELFKRHDESRARIADVLRKGK